LVPIRAASNAVWPSPKLGARETYNAGRTICAEPELPTISRTIRARMEELLHEREEAERTEQAKASEQTTVRVNRMGQVSMAIRRFEEQGGVDQGGDAGPAARTSEHLTAM